MKKWMAWLLAAVIAWGFTGCDTPAQPQAHNHTFSEELFTGIDLNGRAFLYNRTCTSCTYREEIPVTAENFRCNGFFLFTPEELEKGIAQKLPEGYEIAFTESSFDGANGEGPVEECKRYRVSANEEKQYTLLVYCATELGQEMAAQNGFVPMDPLRNVTRIELRLLESHGGEGAPDLQEEDLKFLTLLIELCKPDANAQTVVEGLVESLTAEKAPNTYYSVNMGTYEDLYLLESANVAGTDQFSHYSCYLLPGYDVKEEG